MLAAMRANPLSHQLQLDAWQALGQMTSGHAVNQIRAGDAGAVKAVAAANMRAHPQTEWLQQRANEVLVDMASGNAENRLRAANVGAVVGGCGAGHVLFPGWTTVGVCEAV